MNKVAIIGAGAGAGAIFCGYSDSTSGTAIIGSSCLYYDYQNLLCEFDYLDKWYQSRAWFPAPQVIKPTVHLLSSILTFNRRIAPAPWTGRNFKKVRR